MKTGLISHELGHAVCAEVQDGFWYASGLVLTKDDGALAYCWSEKRDDRKPNINGPYSKIKGMMSLGGVFGEILLQGKWSPWGARYDIDEFATANSKGNNKLMIELDRWLWIDDDELSFKACSTHSDERSRRAFVLDAHDTVRRLPNLWDAYLDFCDRINKVVFLSNVEDIAKSKKVELDEAELKKIVKEIVA